MEEQKFRDRLADGKPVIQDEQAGHRLSGRESGTGEIGHGRAVMGQNNAVVVSGPRQDGGVVRTVEAHVLGPDNVQIGRAQ